MPQYGMPAVPLPRPSSGTIFKLTHYPGAWSRLLEPILVWRRKCKALSGAAALGREQTDWRDAASDWNKLSAAAVWIGANDDIRALAAQLGDRREDVADRAGAAAREALDIGMIVDGLFADLAASSTILLASEATTGAPLDALLDRLELWLANHEQLSKWVAYRDRADKARTLGLATIVDRLDDGRMTPSDVESSFAMTYFEALLADVIRAAPEIGRFDGPLHSGLAREFSNLDRQRIAAASLEVVRAHHKAMPATGGGVGPLGVLRAEMARRRGHMPIRQLMQKAAPTIQALKPVLMMSPLSVAQFLPPGQLTFDLLVMDEASQIQPVDALGAIARCRQVVVIGDEKQLPPTKFFSKMTGGDDADDDDGAQVADIESILGLFRARGLPQRMLRWHYRSRHQSLIAVSNSQFYEDKLYIVPSPYTQEAGMGLSFHHVPDGVFDSGRTSANVIEAKVVAEAIIRHAKAHPDLSLGVATFSIKQRRAIQDELEMLRRLNPDVGSLTSKLMTTELLPVLRTPS